MMKSNDPDVFGELVLAQYQAGQNPVYEIVERDDGFIGASSAQKYFTKYPKWTSEERRAMKLVTGRVLDIGCGAGRHALYLQKKGFDVTGIDISKGAIAVCRKLRLKKAIVRPIENLKGFRAGSFDTVGMFYNNFGLLQSSKKAKQILKDLYRITSPEAQIIADSSNPYTTAKPVHTDYHAFNRKRGRLGGQLRLRLRYNNLIGKWFDYLLVSPEEMAEVLKGTGWEISKLLRGRQGNSKLLKGKRGSYIAIITKSRLK